MNEITKWKELVCVQDAIVAADDDWLDPCDRLPQPNIVLNSLEGVSAGCLGSSNWL